MCELRRRIFPTCIRTNGNGIGMSAADLSVDEFQSMMKWCASLQRRTTMARGKKTGGKNWQPGQSGNPAGGPGLPQDLRDTRKMTSADVTRILTMLMDLSPTERLAYQPKTTLEEIVLSLVGKAIEDGCTNRLNLLFDRIIGKVKDKLEVTLPTPFIVRRQDGSEIVMGAKLLKKDGDE